MLNLHKERAALQLLQWYTDAGVDCTIGDTPINWRDGSGVDRSLLKQFRLNNRSLKKREATQQPQRVNQSSTQNETSLPPSMGQESKQGYTGQPTITPPPPNAALTLGDASLKQAKEIADKCADLDHLRNALAAFDGCSLKRMAKNLVFTRGGTQSDTLFIGEAPSRDDDMSGIAYDGEAGILFDKMRAAIGLDDTNSTATNMVFWRPPGGRPPTPEEAMICRPFLSKLIELTSPKIIVLLGSYPAKIILGETSGIMRLRGRSFDRQIGKKERKMLVTLHPNYLLSTPLAKRLVWQDLLTLKQMLLETTNT